MSFTRYWPIAHEADPENPLRELQLHFAGLISSGRRAQEATRRFESTRMRTDVN